MDPLHSGNPLGQNVTRLNTAGIRAMIKAKRQPELDLITKYAKQYFEEDLPKKNTVAVEEFQRYFPLFKRDMVKSMDEDALSKLSYEYSVRFSSQVPIYIIDSRELDEKGALWGGDGKKHKILITLPARIPRLSAVNKLGGNVVAVAAECLANSRSTSDPFDQKGTYYSNELVKLIKLANASELQSKDADFKKYSEALFHKEEPKKQEEPSQPEPEKPDPSLSSFGPDVEWE